MDSAGNTHGFVYNIAKNSYLEVDDPNATQPGGTTINGINDKGQIVGFYVNGTNTIGFVGTPTPEPGSLALLGSGMLAGLGYLRRKLMR